jgi:hypothetical protein
MPPHPASSVVQTHPPSHTAEPGCHQPPVRFPNHRIGLPMLRAPFPFHACHRQYPGAAVAATTLPFSRDNLSLPRIDWQVGPHITLFEACSAFTHVAACILAKSPSDPLHRRVQPLRYLHDCSGCFRREQNRRAGFAPAGKAPPFHGARRTPGFTRDCPDGEQAGRGQRSPQLRKTQTPV